jgi:DNA-directed RNA polymerase specialized sigma subunit
MARLDFTKPEIAAIKAKIYFTEMEEKVLDMWLKEMTIEEMATELITSQSTISRKKAKIIKKITKAL